MLASWAWMMPGVSLRLGPGGGAVRAALRLLPRDQSPAVLRNAVPRNVLPPERGTMFMIGPPVSVSPRPPPTRTATSSTPTESYTYDDTPPLRAAPTVMPFTDMRPSLLAPCLLYTSPSPRDS